MSKTAEHRPAVRKRRFKHDTVTAVDLFSGFGGLTRGLGIKIDGYGNAVSPPVGKWLTERLVAVL